MENKEGNNDNDFNNWLRRLESSLKVFNNGSNHDNNKNDTMDIDDINNNDDIVTSIKNAIQYETKMPQWLNKSRYYHYHYHYHYYCIIIIVIIIKY